MDTTSKGSLLLIVVAFIIPVAGFILTITHARAGDTRQEQRWRKRHGLLYWVLAPGVAGALSVLGLMQVLPRVFSLVGILALAAITSVSFLIQRRHEERS